MTDNEIKEALECCLKNEIDCHGCPYEEYSKRDCTDRFYADVIELINRQKAEIERLCEQNVRLNKECDYYIRVATAKSEAIKEFAERLKEHTHNIEFYGEIVTTSRIDKLVKEMTEVEE